MSEYYVEDLERLPIAKSVMLYEQHLPHWQAVGLAGWLRFRRWIGWSPRPLYGSRWHAEIQWGTRNDMPAQALSRWAPHLEQLGDSGFSIWGWLKSDTIGAKEEANVLLLNKSGNTLATVIWIRIAHVEELRYTFTSYQADGTEVMTMALPRRQQQLVDVVVPSYVDLLCRPPRTTAKQLYKIHRQRPTIATCLTFDSRSMAEQFNRQRIRLFNHSVNAGILRPLTDREVTSLKGCE